MKRHLDIELLDDIIRALARGKRCPKRTKIIVFQGSGRDTGSAIFNRTGY